MTGGPYYPNQINPRTAPDRFTEHEKGLFEAGKCGWQTAFGMPWMEWCEAPSAPGADFGYCEEHAEEAAENDRDRKAAGL